MRLDIAGYAERRREALRIYTTKLAERVTAEGGEVMLEPMNAADRKVVHDTVAEIEGVRSFSEGEDPDRAVVDRTRRLTAPRPVPGEVSRETSPGCTDPGRFLARDRARPPPRSAGWPSYAEWLITEAVTIGGIGPAEPDRIWQRHIVDSLTFGHGLAEDATCSMSGPGSGFPASPWRSPSQAPT